MANTNNKNNTPALVLLVCLGFLSGCVTTTGKNNSGTANISLSQSSEILLQAAENHSALIELYKQQLKNTSDQNINTETLLKLGKAYLASGDPESTLFYIEPLINAGGDAELMLLKSRALFELGNLDDALGAARVAHNFNTEDPNIPNMLGLIYASTGELEEARSSFMQARAGLLDDQTVKNNLAMLDILENNYVSAVERLMPLYNAGQADERIKANLVFALIKGGMYDEFKAIYTEADTEAERVALFRMLSEVTPHLQKISGAE